MGFFDVLGEALLDATKDTISTSETYQDYRDDFNGVISRDDDYIAMFSKAMKSLASRRSQDSYLRNIMGQTGGNACSAVYIRDYSEPDEHFSVWRVYYGSDQRETRSIKLRFRTPNARQLDRNGNVLRPGCGYEVCKDYDRRQKAIEDRNAALRRRPELVSFLGAKFGERVSTYANSAEEEIKFDNGTVAVSAQMNKFLSFERTFVVRAFDSDEVIGMLCISTSEGKDARREELTRVVSIMEEKYGRKFEHMDDGRLVMGFCKDEAQQEGLYALIMLTTDLDSSLMINVVCVETYGAAKERYEELERKRSEETIAQIRKHAIDSL